MSCRIVVILHSVLILHDPSQALGEAEAELAYLNQSGAIDAIITDDVDTLVFGARMILKK